jgi:hypothetical protein
MNDLAAQYRKSIAMYPIPAEAPPPPARRGTYVPPQFTLCPKSFSLSYGIERGWIPGHQVAVRLPAQYGPPTKPRARDVGNGFWAVRSFRADGWLIQGVGHSLDEAFTSWSKLQ